MDRHNNKLLVLTDAEVDKLLTLSMARAGVQDAMVCHATGRFQMPPKPYLYPAGLEQMSAGGRFISMPASLGPPVNMIGMKWIGSMPSNLDRGLPRASGILALNDPVSAFPLTVMECGALSARRTAAIAGLAVELLAPAGALHVAVVGAGPIAREVVSTLIYFVDGITEIRLCDLHQERAERLRDAVKTTTTIPISVFPTAEGCVRRANVVIAATTGSSNGYLKLAWLTAPWLMIPLSLSDCEADVLLAADKVVVDDWTAANREEKLLHQLTQAGKFDRSDLYAEFGEIVTGRKPGNNGDDKIYCNFMGLGIEDVAVGARVFRAATTSA
ncbi:MAG: 2,3-diaminopropionate biosynthesis protein SbnB [Tepidisphaeraceae bacterium]|jgi:ornithine cyclodeaminase